jgi:hypothetical protein
VSSGWQRSTPVRTRIFSVFQPPQQPSVAISNPFLCQVLRLFSLSDFFPGLFMNAVRLEGLGRTSDHIICHTHKALKTVRGSVGRYSWKGGSVINGCQIMVYVI